VARVKPVALQHGPYLGIYDLVVLFLPSSFGKPLYDMVTRVYSIAVGFLKALKPLWVTVSIVKVKWFHHTLSVWFPGFTPDIPPAHIPDEWTHSWCEGKRRTYTVPVFSLMLDHHFHDGSSTLTHAKWQNTVLHVDMFLGVALDCFIFHSYLALWRWQIHLYSHIKSGSTAAAVLLKNSSPALQGCPTFAHWRPAHHQCSYTVSSASFQWL